MQGGDISFFSVVLGLITKLTLTIILTDHSLILETNPRPLYFHILYLIMDSAENNYMDVPQQTLSNFPDNTQRPNSASFLETEDSYTSWIIVISTILLYFTYYFMYIVKVGTTSNTAR